MALLTKILILLNIIFIPVTIFGAQNDYIDEFGSGSVVSTVGKEGAKSLMYNIGRDLKNVFLLIAGIYLLVSVFTLLFSEGSEEDAKKWKRTIIWTVFGIVMMQTSYKLIEIINGSGSGPGAHYFNQQLAQEFLNGLLFPFLKLIQYIASFAFLAMAVYAFFNMITAGGEEEKIKKGRTVIFNSIVGFIIVQVSWQLVSSIYGQATAGILSRPQINDTTRLLVMIINYFMSFLGIIVIIFVIYAGWLTMTSGGDDENTKKAKNIIKYVIYGIILMGVSYMLFNFFIDAGSAGNPKGVRTTLF